MIRKGLLDAGSIGCGVAVAPAASEAELCASAAATCRLADVRVQENDVDKRQAARTTTSTVFPALAERTAAICRRNGLESEERIAKPP
jgi:pantoate kinase